MLTKRGHQLIYNGVSDRPIVTVELYCKWYSLYLIQPNGSVEEFIPPTEEVSFKDDTFNPIELVQYALKMNYLIDDLAFELIIGRWETETLENYCNDTLLV